MFYTRSKPNLVYGAEKVLYLVTRDQYKPVLKDLNICKHFNAMFIFSSNLHHFYLRSTKLWRPRIHKCIFYSEILDKYYALTCTRRALSLIEEAKGFDNYILEVNAFIYSYYIKAVWTFLFSTLQTHEVDLQSNFGMNLKREMLVTLAKKKTDLYPNDKEKQELIYNRYKKYVLPVRFCCFKTKF